MRSAVILLAGVLSAAPGPTEVLQQRDAEIRAALPPAGSPLGEEARRRLERIFGETVDLEGMAREALGARWGKMTGKQRRRLLAAFEKRFKRIGTDGLDDYRQTQIEYAPEERVSEDVVKVPTRVEAKGETAEITYAMRRDRESWRIVDIVVDGVSTVENYRGSFARVIAKEGVEGLIRRLDKGAAGGRPGRGEKS